MKNKKVLMLISTAILLALFAGGSFLYKNQEKKRIEQVAKENGDIFVRPHAPILGDANAKVTLVEFLDPECEGCRAFYPEVKKILAKYQGQLKLVVRFVPLHANSVFAIKVLEGAKRQGKFWEALELMFETQSVWADHMSPRPERLWEILPRLGLDIDKIKKEMDDAATREMIDQDMRDGSVLNLSGTPSFFINGRPIPELNPEAIKAEIEVELKKN